MANTPNPHVHRAVEICRAAAGPCLTCGKYILPLVLLLALVGSIFYVRILYGPISLKILAKPIARSIAAEMPGFGVTIEDALVRLDEEGEIQFRLRNVQLLDEQGSPVAIAPLAAVELSADALWSARLSPEEVVLIEPRLLLTYSAERGLSFSFTRPADGAASSVPSENRGPDAIPAPETAPGGGAGPGLPVALRQLDLARVIAEASARARNRSDAASFLRQIGMRNATLIFENGSSRTVWQVPEADLAVRHKESRSVIQGSISVASSRGPWTMQFWSDASGETEQVNLRAAIRNLVPHTIANTMPAFAQLRGFDVPASGDVTLQLTSAGELLGGSFSLALSRGELRFPWLADLPLAIQGGSLELRYDPGGRELRVEPSTLIWGRSHLTIAGKVASTFAPDGAEVWAYQLRGVEGSLAPEALDAAPVPVESWSAEGSFQPVTGAFAVDQRLIAGGGELRLSGAVDGSRIGSGVRVDGEIGNMPLSTILGFWPRALEPEARKLVEDNLVGGQILGGSLRFDSGFGTGNRNGSERLSLALQGADLLIRPESGLPPIEIPRALVRLEGSTLEITVPEASVLLSEGRKIALKSGRFTVIDVLSDQPTGQIAFQGEGLAPALLELIEHEAFGIGHLSGVSSETLEGKVEASLSITLPLRRGITLADLKLKGVGRLSEGRSHKLIGRHGAQAATVAFDITEKAIDAKGDMLLSGVPVKLAWQHIFDAAPEKQPPLRLTATLDGADREQLGIDVNDLVHGEVPLELTVTQTAEQEERIHVWADLTRADLVLDNVAWRKPPGRSAIMQFDLHDGTRYRTELHDFKIVGDDIAISGWMGLDDNDRLREFHFPEFSANVITRLEVRGKLRDDRVWEIVTQGQTYDGRDVFRSLFSVGELADQSSERRNTPGLDLKANIGTVVGFSDVALRGLTLQLSRRDGKLTELKLRGNMDGGKTLEVELQRDSNRQRRLVALSDDAGQAFRLVDFYPSLVGGRMRLDINLEGRGAAEKTGLLRVERFRILGDPVVSEVLQVPDENRPYEPRQQRVVRQTFDFDWMRVPFSVGHGQFVMGDSEIRGSLVGATMRGKADFRSRQVNIGGTYVPLQGLNSALGVIPGLGQILAGPRGEGVLGITFAIRGSMSQPEVLVNPLSLVTPGIFREMFQMTPSQSVTPPRAAPQRPSTRSKSSSAPTSAPRRRTGAVEPEVLSGWSSETRTGPETRKK